MKSKKKFIIAMSSLVGVVAILVVAIVAILAVPNAEVKPKFSVKYTATDISATVSANTIVGGTRTAMQTSAGEEQIVFRATDEEQAATLTPQNDDIALSAEHSSVIFEYIFTNNSNSVDTAVSMTREFEEFENIILGYSFSYSQVEDFENMPLTTTFAPMMILGEEREEGKYNTLYVYIKVSVSNLANDSGFGGNLQFALSQDEPVKLNFENVENATNASLFNTWLAPKSYVGSGSDYMGYAFGLPQPSFETGAYTWYADEALTTRVDYPFMFDEDTTIYAGVADYEMEFLSEFMVIDDFSYMLFNISFSSDGAQNVLSSITNTSSEKIYVSIPTISEIISGEDGEDEFFLAGFMYSKNVKLDYEWLWNLAINSEPLVLPAYQKVANDESAYFVLDSGEQAVFLVNTDVFYVLFSEDFQNTIRCRTLLP